MEKRVTEWQILFTMTSGKDDFYTEDEDEYNEYFQELKDNGELNTVEQCIKKDYIWNDETEDWEEDWVDVLYDSSMDLQEAKYNIYTTSGEDGVYNTTLYDTVDSEEQASDMVSELQAQGLSADYEKVDEEYNKIPKKLEEDETPDIVEYNITDDDYENNADTVYGRLSDGTYFVYYTEMDLVETYDCEPDELLEILYADEDELPAEAREEAFNEFFEQHNVDTYGPGDELYEKLHKLYYEEDSLEEAKTDNSSKLNIEYVTPNYTGGGIYVYTGKLSNNNYFIATDSSFMVEDDYVSPFDVRIVNKDPDKTYKDDEGYDYTLLDDITYQDECLVKDLDENEALKFTIDILKWIIEYKPKGNYQIDDMQDMLDTIKSTDTNNKKVEEVVKNSGKDKSDFKRKLKSFDENGKYAKRGNWEIGRGGYDLWYEISYNGVPVIGCTAGKVNAYQKGFEEYAKLTAEEYGDTYVDTLTEGKVTTTSGTYDTDKYDEICNKVKQAYKDTWAGKISYSDLEDIKKQSGLSNGELSSIQYMASRETDKKEETKKFDINDDTKFISYEPEMTGTYTLQDMKDVYNNKVSNEYKKEGSDFKDWLYDMLKSGVYEIEEAKSIDTLEQKIKSKIQKVLQRPDFGFTEKDVDDYTVVEISQEDIGTKVQVRAELDYEAFEKLINELNPIVQAYDKNSYFEMEEPGIASAIISNTTKKVTESMAKDDIMQCYISDITRYAYTYKKKDAQKEIDFVLDDLKNDKDLDDKDKAFIMKMVRPALLDKNIDYEDIIVENKVMTESTNLTDLQVGMTMFRYYINGATIYLETDKKIRNKADANTIFDIYAKYSNMDLAKYTQEQIDKAKDMILAQMELVTITNINDNGFSYKGNNSGGSEDITEIDTIDNKIYAICDSYKMTEENKLVKCEAVDKEEVQDKVEQDIQNTGIKDDIDTEDEAKEATKKEVYQYAKQQGLDLEKLRKQGIDLAEVSDTLDKVIGNMVSKSIIEYEDKIGKSVTWDFDVKNNDIEIIISEL